jgi:hypothetical protein
MNKYDAYDLALKIVNKMNNPIMPTGKQVLTADGEYLCKQLEPIIEAYKIIKENYVTRTKSKTL